VADLTPGAFYTLCNLLGTLHPFKSPQGVSAAVKLADDLITDAGIPQATAGDMTEALVRVVIEAARRMVLGRQLA